MSFPCIDHSGLSPSGRVSKRARAAWLKRETDRLFPPGYWESLEPPKPSEREQVEHDIKYFRELMERGITPRKMAREIEKLENKLKTL